MSSNGETPKRANTAAKPMAPVSEMIFALKSLKPSSRSQKAARFAELYDVIKELLDQDVYQKDILAILAKNGLSLSPLTFRQYFDAEHNLRQEDRVLIVPRLDESLGSLVINSESLPTDHSMGQGDESAEHTDAEKTQGLIATNAGEHAVGVRHE